MASNSSSSAAASSYGEPFRGLPPIVLGHILTFAVPFLLPSITVRALCRDLKEEVDGGVLHQQYGAWATSPQMLTAACLRALLCAPDLRAYQLRLPVPDVSAVVDGRSMGASTCLDVKGDFACFGFTGGEALVFSLPRGTDGLGGVGQPALLTALAGARNEGHQQQPGIVHRIVAHRGKVTAVALLGGGRVLTGGDDGAVKLWAPASAGGGLLRTFRALPASAAAAGAGGTVVEAIVCEDPDLFVLSSSSDGPGGPKLLSLTWFDFYTGQPQAAPHEFPCGAPPPGQVNESPLGRLGCLAWDGRGRHLFVGGVERGAVLMIRATEGSGELAELGSLRRHTGVVVPPSWAANGAPLVVGLQVYELDALPAFAYPNEGGWDRGERRLVAADADRCLIAWTIPSEGVGKEHVDADSIKCALQLRWPAGSRQCLALDAVSNTGLLLAAFYGAQSPQCLEMEGAIKREASNQMGGSVLIPRLWAAGGVLEAAVEEDGVAGATGRRLKRTTELVPSLFPYGQPATCLQLQRSTGRLVIGLMDGSLRLVSLRSSEGAWDQLRRLQQPQKIPEKRKRAREDESA